MPSLQSPRRVECGTKRSPQPMADLPVCPMRAAKCSWTASIESAYYSCPFVVDFLPLGLSRTSALMSDQSTIATKKYDAKKKDEKGVDSPGGKTRMVIRDGSGVGKNILHTPGTLFCFSYSNRSQLRLEAGCSLPCYNRLTPLLLRLPREELVPRAKRRNNKRKHLKRK